MSELLRIIQRAERERIAVGHFNVANFEQLEAVARAAMRLDVPVIVGVSEGEEEYLGIHRVRDLVASYNAEHIASASARRRSGYGFHLYLNADHTHSLEPVREVARAGFHAVLFDGGRMPLGENIELTKRAVALAKGMSREVLVEGEMGYLGGSSEVLEKVPAGAAVRPGELTEPEDAARFVRETGVDLLAPAVGNIHGIIRGIGNPPLDIARIKAIKKVVGIPLVLHGGSGISDADFVAAIDAGISVIHISTELRVAWRVGLEHSLKAHPQEVAPYKLMPEALAAMENVVERRLKLFGKI